MALLNTCEEWTCPHNLYHVWKIRLLILGAANKLNQFILSIQRVKAVTESSLSSFFREEMSSRKNYGLPMVTYNLISYRYHRSLPIKRNNLNYFQKYCRIHRWNGSRKRSCSIWNISWVVSGNWQPSSSICWSHSCHEQQPWKFWQQWGTQDIAVMTLTTLPLPDSQGLGNGLAPTYCLRISSAGFPIIALIAPLKVLIQ